MTFIAVNPEVGVRPPLCTSYLPVRRTFTHLVIPVQRVEIWYILEVRTLNVLHYYNCYDDDDDDDDDDDYVQSLSLSHSTGASSPWAHLHVVGMLQFMFDINQQSLPSPVNSVLVSISVCMAL